MSKVKKLSQLWAGLREKTRKPHTHIHTDRKDMKRTHWSDNSKHSKEERNYKIVLFLGELFLFV